jgi:hypothetical protein
VNSYLYVGIDKMFGIHYCKIHKRLFFKECINCIWDQDFLDDYNNEMFWQMENGK